MKPCSANKTDLFAADHYREKIDRLGDPLKGFASHIDSAALAAEVDRVAPRPGNPQGGGRLFPTETMVWMPVLKRQYNLSDEQMERQLQDRMIYECFCGLTQVANISDRIMIWTFESGMVEAGAKAIFDGVSAQLLRHGYLARGGQAIDATLALAPKQQIIKEE